MFGMGTWLIVVTKRDVTVFGPDAVEDERARKLMSNPLGDSHIFK